VMNADGTKQKNLTRNSVTDRDPTWSPDGKRIAFERDGGGVSRDIFRMRADGTRQFNLTDNSAIDADPAWQPR
jgi:TolB protein